MFVSSCGVIQLIATHQNLTGIRLLKTRIPSLFLGLALLVTPFIWFFGSEPRNIPDNLGGLDGNQQALLFVIGSMSGISFSLLIASLINSSLGRGSPNYPRGLDGLREANYLRAFLTTVKRIWLLSK